MQPAPSRSSSGVSVLRWRTGTYPTFRILTVHPGGLPAATSTLIGSESGFLTANWKLNRSLQATSITRLKFREGNVEGNILTREETVQEFMVELGIKIDELRTQCRRCPHSTVHRRP